jgi:hypothetical protein
MGGQAEHRHFYSKKDSKPQGKLQEILRIENNPHWLNAMSFRSAGPMVCLCGFARKGLDPKALGRSHLLH